MLLSALILRCRRGAAKRRVIPKDDAAPGATLQGLCHCLKRRLRHCNRLTKSPNHGTSAGKQLICMLLTHCIRIRSQYRKITLLQLRVRQICDIPASKIDRLFQLNPNSIVPRTIFFIALGLPTQHHWPDPIDRSACKSAPIARRRAGYDR